MSICTSNNAHESVLESIETQSAISIPTETESTASNIQRKPYGRRLDQKDEILLFQLCIQHLLSFQSVKNHKQFWIKISGLFEQTVSAHISDNQLNTKLRT